jgi:glycosyltransferase involved in cell wall biosynthesis
MEAMALGRPVISTYVAGIPELVRPGENGWLVPPSDVEALAGAMREALAAPAAEIAKMGAAGRKRVEERHDAAREAGKLKELFAQASKTHGAAVD